MTPATGAAFAAAYEAMLRLWTVAPEARDVVTAGGETTRVHLWGKPDAPPLVLLHGFHATSTMWAPNAADLGAVRRVYAPDTRGDFGFSRAAKVPRSIDELVAWLSSLLDALGLDAVDLGGMSYGGWLAAHFAARHPERVRRLVLLAPGASFGAFSLAFVLRGLPMVALKRRRFAASYLRWAAVPAVDDARYESWMEALIDVMHTGVRAFRGPTLPYPQKLPPAIMRAIGTPTLLVYGEQEKMYGAPAAIAVARAHLPTLETVLVPDASHDLTLRQAARVDEAIVRFLA